ncbi:hypothetical protein EBU95_16975 [bacterium]|jgi:hypothetical protein|nr:hypothetical protein [bacterium]
MKHQFIVNGIVNLILSPENDMEKSLLETLSSQTNDLKSVSKSSSVGAQYSDGSIIISAVHADKTKTV